MQQGSRIRIIRILLFKNTYVLTYPVLAYVNNNSAVTKRKSFGTKLPFTVACDHITVVFPPIVKRQRAAGFSARTAVIYCHDRRPVSFLLIT